MIYDLNTLTRLLLLLLAGLIMVGCTTQKRRDDQSALGKAWHNMNAHYNGYFNAQEILEESIVLLQEQHDDNYNQQLDMFPFMAADNPSVVYEELDNALEKVTIVTRKHPYSNWTDDCYVLAGQAQFLKRDYESAEKTFRFVVNEYRPRPKRRKGKKGSSAVEEEDDGPRGPRIEKSQAQERRDRISAREDAKKERERIIKDRQKERKKEIRERRKEIKARQRARKKGIKVPRRTTPAPDTLQKEPEQEVEAVAMDEGPVGMISIFNKSRDLGLENEQYGDKPDAYFMKHRPSFQEARLWLAWTLVKRDVFDQAQIILEDMRNDRGTFPEIRRAALAVQAFLYLESDRAGESIPYLMEAGEAARDRNEAARYYYIAGQLHQRLNEPLEAFAAFEKVVDTKPNYDLEFGARLNMAQNEYLSGGGSAADAIARLDKMRREEKNLPYESQLYFSMASIALRSGDEVAGKEYLQEALASPSAQANNRVEAYSLMAKLNYDETDYLAAKLYYDSTLTYMPKTDVRFAETEKRRDELVDIADYIQSVEVKDSLLRLAELPEEERMQKAEEMLTAQREAQRAAKLAAAQAGSSSGGRPVAVANLGQSDFWAYDSRTVKRGMRDFERKFGDRPLQDNWRRGSNNTSLFEAEGDAIAIEEDAPILVTPEEAARLLKGVPTTDNAKEAMRIELQEALFNLGRLYRTKLNDNAKTVEALEELHARFPRTNYEAESWYYLYLAHSELGNSAAANEYKNKLTQKWGSTKFAKILNDPNFVNEFKGEEARLQQEYENAYQLFEAGQFQQAYDRSMKGLSKLLGQHPLKAKYSLLAAMATGNLQGKEAYVAALRQVVAKYDGAPEQTRAKEILRLLGVGGAALPGGISAGNSNFKPTPEELHYLIVVFDNSDIDLNKAKIKVSDYNTKHHKLDRLRITNVYLGRDNSTPVLVMRRFTNAKAAMEYYDGTSAKAKDFLSRTEVDYQIFPVSQSNYREILKARSIDGYDEFFRSNY